MDFRIKHAAKRDGYAFALANGLPATMYRLDNPLMYGVASANGDKNDETG